MTIDKPNSAIKYDVAISFLVQDLALAQALHDKLSEGLRVFFFPRNQEELAGTDGLESMRAPFRTEALINVVLYRERWGNTPWTAVEAAAIKDSCLSTAFRSLFFFVVEPSSKMPAWLPDTHVRFNYRDFTLDQAVGAIKLRVQERGGHYRPLTPAKKAELIKAEEDFRRAKAYMASREGVARIFLSVKEMFEEIRRLCDEVNAAGDAHIDYHLDLEENTRQQTCTLSSPRVGLVFIWYQPFAGSLQDAACVVREFNGNMILPPGRFHLQPPEIVRETKYEPELSRALEYGWKPLGRHKSFISSKEFASQCVIQFLDLIDRDRNGKVKRKGWDQ